MNKIDEQSKNLSGGMKRKLSLACAFIGNPSDCISRRTYEWDGPVLSEIHMGSHSKTSANGQDDHVNHAFHG